jgi:hypothetical protein
MCHELLAWTLPILFAWTNRYELPQNHCSMISMILLPLWHQFPKANHPLMVEVEVEDRMADAAKTREAQELDTPSRSDL